MPISSSIQHNDINSIRAEIRDENSYSKIADSEFSDDTHDWGGDSCEFSDEYWHFLGSFE